jgi:hypothetical protein
MDLGTYDPCPPSDSLAAWTDVLARLGLMDRVVTHECVVHLGSDVRSCGARRELTEESALAEGIAAWAMESAHPAQGGRCSCTR